MLEEQLRFLNRNAGFAYLTYSGLLPVNLPDGTRVVFLPDMHVPAHDAKVVWAIVNFLGDFLPHILVFLGDVADIFGLSKYPKPPRVVSNFQTEIDSTRRVVDALISAANPVHTFYIVGNHEERCANYLRNMAPQLVSSLSYSNREPVFNFHNLLGYSSRDPVTFIYDLHDAGGRGGGIFINNDVEINHGFITRQKPIASPAACVDKVGHSKVHGHTHRFGFFARSMLTKDVFGAELGHLADATHPYLGYANLTNNWHQGFGVGLVASDKFHLQPVPVKKITIDGHQRSVFTYADKIYRSSNR